MMQSAQLHVADTDEEWNFFFFFFLSHGMLLIRTDEKMEIISPQKNLLKRITPNQNKKASP